jgi:hypothetical protein
MDLSWFLETQRPIEKSPMGHSRIHMRFSPKERNQLASKQVLLFSFYTIINHLVIILLFHLGGFFKVRL